MQLPQVTAAETQRQQNPIKASLSTRTYCLESVGVHPFLEFSKFISADQDNLSFG